MLIRLQNDDEAVAAGVAAAQLLEKVVLVGLPGPRARYGLDKGWTRDLLQREYMQ